MVNELKKLWSTPSAAANGEEHMKTVIDLAREAGFAERDAMFRVAFVANKNNLERFAELVRADERTRMAKQPAQQEPYCYTYTENGEEYFAPPKAYVPDDAMPLFTFPPAQRTWVGLTESDRRLINFQSQDGNGTATEIIDLTEAKLKEKNT